MARQVSVNDIQVAIFLALQVEVNAMDRMLDERVTINPNQDILSPWARAHISNKCIPGRIGDIYVVLVPLPRMGTEPAASAATTCRHIFPRVELALVVGVCGAVPSYRGRDGTNRAIGLGDVVISEGFEQYNLGSSTPEGFQRKGGPLYGLPQPNQELRSFIAKLRTPREVAEVQEQIADGRTICRYKKGRFAGDSTTATATTAKIPWHQFIGRSFAHVQSGYRSAEAAIHFGLVASGNTVIKHAGYRDNLAKEIGAIAFEMEGAGVCTVFEGTTLIIKAVCDYADAHKAKEWQPRAALTAAICVKSILTSHWSPTRLIPRRGLKAYCTASNASEYAGIIGYLEDTTDPTFKKVSFPDLYNPSHC
ncbi:hypothetical protein VHEMI07757 [[Torrubiella] hemipterigena]|uniref:Nucleoside phosphorylase domain-containing protein n=1 Tax=[Torrubiella] hemipterigena TaxID=1531966 RepID=A0A0A1TLY5_9HYPO|nr:hypothetical protein VHEMI07757 [[Torrubiella] hemipterigena]